MRIHPRPVDPKWSSTESQAISGPKAVGTSSDSIESAVGSIWQEVLSLEQVDATQSLYALGGDSIAMIRIASRLRERYGVRCGLTELFADPTVRGIAGVILSQIAVSSQMAVFHDAATASIGETAAHVGNRPEATIVIPTCDRPSALIRCVTTVAENLARSGRTAELIIRDSSPGASNMALQTEIEKICKRHGLTSYFVDNSKLRDVIDSISGAGCDLQLIDFAFGMGPVRLPNIGGNRNALLVAVRPGPFLSLDDDTECRFARVPQGETTGGVEEQQVWVCEPDGTDFETEFVDFVGLHEATFRAGIKTNRSQDERTPLITLNGLYGDCGWGSPSPYLFLPRSSFSRLTLSVGRYHRSVLTRRQLKGYSAEATTYAEPELMTTAFGVHSNERLPPFFPYGRGSDAVLGTILQHGWRPMFLHVPWAIVHRPVESRRFWPGEIMRDAASVDLRGLLAAVLEMQVFDSKRPSTHGAKANGQYLLSVASQTTADFLSTIKDAVRSRNATRRAFLEKRHLSLGTAEGPWYDDLSRYVGLLAGSESRSHFAIPTELIEAKGSPEEALSETKRLIALYGQLLYNWEELGTLAHNLLMNNRDRSRS